jgi:hypothetical protein
MENVGCSGDMYHVTAYSTFYKLSDVANGHHVLPSTETEYPKKNYM